jgi:GT2 family glycosyltransferase
VVASNRSRRLLEACLSSVLPQCQASDAELVVARSGERADLDWIRARFPTTHVIDGGPRRDIPRLRGLGLSAATGRLVALTEDHCLADPQWLAALTEAARHADVVGGGGGNARTARAVDCGAYFAEYGFFNWTRSETSSSVPLLTGANVAYSRAVVSDVARWANEGHWESGAHQRRARRGCRLMFVPGARVRQNATVGFLAFCADRYRHGRDHARVFAAEGDRFPRWVRLLGTPLLPGLLVWRVYRAAGAEHRGRFFRALPFTAAFLTAWSAGEAVGYISGHGA